MSDSRRNRVARHRAAILIALYRMEGTFTLSQLADAAGGQILYSRAAEIVRERVANGAVVLVNGKSRPRLYRVAPDA